MATYNELRNLFADVALMNRVQVACIVAAEAIRNESDQTANHANRLVWAQKAFSNPGDVSQKMLMSLLAANKDATVATIQSVTDANLQTAVNGAVNLFADGT